MAIFQKKTTLVHHITYMGLMTAINVIFIVLARFLPMLMFLLIIFLPFASTVVAYFCKKRFYIIYALASIGLCLIFNISDTIFYIVPAVITGFVIGVLLDKKAHPFWLILASSIVNAALSLAFIPLIKLMTNVNLVETVLKMFQLTDFIYKSELVCLFVYFLSLLQCALTHFVLLVDGKKIGIEINTRIDSFAPFIICLEIAILFAFCCSFFYKPLSFVFVLISLYFSVYLFIDAILSKRIAVYVCLGILFVVSIFTFALLYTMLEKPLGLLVVLLFPISMGITSFIKNYLLKAPSNI